jgi:hypothetical protein
LFFRGVTVRTAGRVAIVVGTILSAVNQGSTIAAGNATWVTWVRVVVNYCVPFCVASIGFLAACRIPTSDRAPVGEAAAGGAAVSPTQPAGEPRQSAV